MCQGDVMMPQCDLILVTWNHLEYTRPCVESVLRHTGVPYRLLIVDNGSAADTLAFLDGMERTQPDRVVSVRNPENLGWVKAVNEGLRRSQAPYVCLLNNDVVVTPGWLERMIEVAQADPRIGLVNPTYNGRGEPLEAFRRRVNPMSQPGRDYLEVNECNGACLLIRRALLEAIGGLDEAYGSGGLDDADYSRRAQVAGFRCARASRARVFHWENVSCNSVPHYWTETRRRNEALFVQRWGERTQVAVVLSGDGEHARRLMRQCVALGRLGVRVHLWALLAERSPLRDPAERWRMALVEHNNFKWVVWRSPKPPLLRGLAMIGLCLVAALKAFGRRGKGPGHRIQTFIVPAAGPRAGLRWLQWLHGSRVVPGIERCQAVARERGWSQALEPELWL